MTAHTQTLLLAGGLAAVLILILVVSTRMMLAARRQPRSRAATEQAYQELAERIAFAQEASAASLSRLQSDFTEMRAKLDAVERVLLEKERKPSEP
ncbi:hypothetical protein [Agaricicola taiwanensis]|nr:hypothetical protein [Agaricicola taiwanensis]